MLATFNSASLLALLMYGIAIVIIMLSIYIYISDDDIKTHDGEELAVTANKRCIDGCKSKQTKFNTSILLKVLTYVYTCMQIHVNCLDVFMTDYNTPGDDTETDGEESALGIDSGGISKQRDFYRLQETRYDSRRRGKIVIVLPQSQKVDHSLKINN